MSRTFVIGDVHGCTRELGALVQKLAPEPGDSFVFVGDLLDKGPDSVGTVRYVRDLKRYYSVTLVEGNHEEKHRRFRRHVAAGNDSVAASMKQADVMRQTTSELCADDIAFLDNAALWCPIGGDPFTPDHVVVHGGIMPNWHELPAINPYLLPGKARKEALKALRLRHVTKDGGFVMLGEDGPDTPFWATGYDGRFGFCFFGHEPFMQKTPKKFKHAAGLDLGCVFGGQLCAAVLANVGGNFNEYVENVTVPAFDTYAQRRKNPKAETKLEET
jgi:hypothetical protein